jgi:hypothetical protein
VEQQQAAREELIHAVRELWDKDRRSVIDGYKQPQEYYLVNRRRMLAH